MTAQALAGAFAGLFLAATVVVATLYAERRADRARHRELEISLRDERTNLATYRRRAAELDATARGYRAQRDELQADRDRRPLEGELVLVNTPKPDDQTLRGIVARELDNGALVLQAAVYIDREVGRGGVERPRETPAGDVVVPAYAFAQVLQPTAPAAPTQE